MKRFFPPVTFFPRLLPLFVPHLSPLSARLIRLPLSFVSLRHRHCGRQRQEGRGLQGQIPEAGPVQPGTDQGHVAGPDTDGRDVRASRDLPDPAVGAGDGGDGVPHLGDCGDPGSQ